MDSLSLSYIVISKALTVVIFVRYVSEFIGVI